MKLILPILTVLLMAASPLAAQEAGRLTVQGQGAVDLAPDMATISLGVTSEAASGAAALAENSAITAKILAVVEKAGILPRDMQTNGLSLSPLWNNRRSGSKSRPEIVGFVASNRVQVRVRDLDSLGGILDAVVGAGANQFNGLNFGLQDPVPAADNARDAAIKDAMRKAGLYAASAGIFLGPIISIDENNTMSPGEPVMMLEAMQSGAVPIAQGEVSMRARVTIVFEILR